MHPRSIAAFVEGAAVALLVMAPTPSTQAPGPRHWHEVPSQNPHQHVSPDPGLHVLPPFTHMWPPWPPGMNTPALWHGYQGVGNVPTLVRLPLPPILPPGLLQPTENTLPTPNPPTMRHVTRPYPKPWPTFRNPDEENDMPAATLAAIMGDPEQKMGPRVADSKPAKRQGGK